MLERLWRPRRTRIAPSKSRLHVRSGLSTIATYAPVERIYAVSEQGICATHTRAALIMRRPDLSARPPGVSRPKTDAAVRPSGAGGACRTSASHSVVAHVALHHIRIFRIQRRGLSHDDSRSCTGHSLQSRHRPYPSSSLRTCRTSPVRTPVDDDAQADCGGCRASQALERRSRTETSVSAEDLHMRPRLRGPEPVV